MVSPEPAPPAHRHFRDSAVLLGQERGENIQAQRQRPDPGIHGLDLNQGIACTPRVSRSWQQKKSPAQSLAPGFVPFNTNTAYFFKVFHSSMTALQAGVAFSIFSGLATHPLLPPPPATTSPQGPPGAIIAAHSFSKAALLDASSAAKALQLNNKQDTRIIAILISCSPFTLGVGEPSALLSIKLYLMIIFFAMRHVANAFDRRIDLLTSPCRRWPRYGRGSARRCVYGDRSGCGSSGPGACRYRGSPSPAG